MNTKKGKAPHRAVERDYLAALVEAVTPEDWKAICRSAAEQAKAGDAKAREWLGRVLLGETPGSLLTLAADEHVGFDAATEIEREGRKRDTWRCLTESALQ